MLSLVTMLIGCWLVLVIRWRAPIHVFSPFQPGSAFNRDPHPSQYNDTIEPYNEMQASFLFNYFFLALPAPFGHWLEHPSWRRTLRIGGWARPRQGRPQCCGTTFICLLSALGWLQAAISAYTTASVAISDGIG